MRQIFLYSGLLLGSATLGLGLYIVLVEMGILNPSSSGAGERWLAITIFLSTVGLALSYYCVKKIMQPGQTARKEENSNGVRRHPGAISKEGNIFISYRRMDSEHITGRIYDRLTQAFGKDRVFKDVDSIPYGVDFRSKVDEMLHKCDIFIAVIGNQWAGDYGEGKKRHIDNSGDYVRIEIEAALNRNIPVIPILVRGTEIPSERDLPKSIRQLSYRNGVTVRADPDFHRDLDRLIEGIDSLLKARKG